MKKKKRIAAFLSIYSTRESGRQKKMPFEKEGICDVQNSHKLPATISQQWKGARGWGGVALLRWSHPQLRGNII